MNTKTCIQCNNKKLLTEFYKHKKSPQGRASKCKKCERKYQLDRYHDPKFHTPQGSVNYHKNYRKENKDKIKEYNKEYYKKSQLKYKTANKKFKQNNPEYHNKWTKQRYSTDMEFRLQKILRIRICQAVQNYHFNKKDSSIEELGCSIKEYVLHLESMFDGNMNWDNYGTYWEIDHIHPISKGGSFHYTNTQPLTIKENRKKSNKII